MEQSTARQLIKAKFPPDIDGKVLTEAVGDTFATGKQAHVPFIAGWNADEFTYLAMRGMTTAQWKEWAEKNFKGRAPEVLKLFGTLGTRPGWNVQPEDRKLS